MPLTAAFHARSEVLTEEFEVLFQQHSRLVHRTAYSVTGNAHDAEDVVQTLFLRLLRKGVPPGMRENPTAYFYRAAVNRALNVVKQRERSSTEL